MESPVDTAQSGPRPRMYELCMWLRITWKFHYWPCLGVTWNHMALYNNKVNCQKCLQVMLRVCLKLQKCWVEIWKAANAHLWFVGDKPLVLARYIASYIIMQTNVNSQDPCTAYHPPRDMPLRKSLCKVTVLETDMTSGGYSSFEKQWFGVIDYWLS